MHQRFEQIVLDTIPTASVDIVAVAVIVILWLKIVTRLPTVVMIIHVSTRVNRKLTGDMKPRMKLS